MGQHRDLKINYDNLGVIYDTIKKYIDALKDLQTSTNTFVNVINEQKGDTFVELNKEFEDSITVDYDDLISVLTEVYNNFGSYMKDMTALISPEDSSVICRVDRNDIAWNLQQIRCIPYAYVGDHPTVPSHIYFDEFVNPFADDADEVRARNEENRRKRERNYDKLVNFYNANILQTASALSNEVDGLNKIHNDYVIEYENTDDIYASRLDDIYDSIKDWKDILEDIWNVVKDIFRGFGRGIVDLIKGLKAPLEIALALNPNIYLPLGVRAAFLSDGVNELYQFGKAFVDDPENAIGAIFQGIADTSDEEGFAFSAGYVGEKIVEVVLAKKLAEKISGPGVEATPETYPKSSIETLQNTENFTDSAIEHIFEGQINKKGKAVGYHYEGIENTAGHVVEGTASTPNQYGTYKAQVEVSGIQKTANGGFSNFFNRNWSPQEVVDAINEAYSNCELVPGSRNTYLGITAEGLEIEMYLDKARKIISAFPFGE